MENEELQLYALLAQTRSMALALDELSTLWFNFRVKQNETIPEFHRKAFEKAFNAFLYSSDSVTNEMKDL